MKRGRSKASAESGGCDRRAFLRTTAVAAGGLALGGTARRATAYGTQRALYRALVPEGATFAAKGIPAGWPATLRVREAAEPVATKATNELRYIGLPVGGIGCGTLYLGGDGRLWLWDIMYAAGVGIRPRSRSLNGKSYGNSSGVNYFSPLDAFNASPPADETPRPIEQGFALHTVGGGVAQTHALDQAGFADIAFRGGYPLATVAYADPACPLSVELTAHPPFIPLNPSDSALPVAILEYRLRNDSSDAVEATILGWLDNPVFRQGGVPAGMTRVNAIRAGDGFGFLECAAQGGTGEHIVFDDFERADYAPWTVEGAAFGTGPIRIADIPSYQGNVNGRGDRVVNSHASAPGSTTAQKDAATGKLTSPGFTIARGYIHFLLGGGNHAGQTCMNLVVGGATVRTQTGSDSNAMTWRTWDVSALAGQSAHVEIVDAHTGAWGNVGVDQIVFSDDPSPPSFDPNRTDYGTIGIAELGPEAGRVSAADHVSDAFPWMPGKPAGAGGIGRTVTLAPGAEATVKFAVAWHFANLTLSSLPPKREYANRFADAWAVAGYVAANYDRLAGDTRAWVAAWKDSTLPYWFLDRAMATAATLATANCYWFNTGRFYGWEGVGCCAGTCAHVWYYAQALAHLFPSLERGVRQNVDLNPAVALRADGSVKYRGEFNNDWAWDGQAGVVLRCYREHRLSPDGAFLAANWTNVKQVLQYLVGQDGNGDGVSEGRQPNTLDADWYGRVPEHIGLYAAALRAGSEMARERGETAFASTCAALAAQAAARLAERFTAGADYGEGYYAHLLTGTNGELGHAQGCYIDQAMGQLYAHLLGLGRVTDAAPCRAALRSVWRFNYSHDLTAFLASADLKQGRPYQRPGEAGTLICTFPNDGNIWSASWQSGYFAECMTGFEYEVAAHCLAEGLLDEGLLMMRAVYDRYRPAKRNPFNEIECSDHYARAMSSYACFLAACGFEHHGPRGRLGFAPKLTPESFRAAFTAAEGWGTLAQTRDDVTQTNRIEVARGRLRLRTFATAAPANCFVGAPAVMVNGQPVRASMTRAGDRVEIELTDEQVLEAGAHIVFSFRCVADADGDGLPDEYERRHGLNPRLATDAVRDADGDGVANLAEFAAGTDPRAAASVLAATAVAAADGGVDLAWRSVPGRIYDVEAGDPAQPDAWAVLAAGVPAGPGATTVWRDSAAGTVARRLYRIRVRGP